MAFEIYLEHYKASFGDRWMWTPIVLTPPLTAAGVAAVSPSGSADGAPRRLRALRPDGLVGVVTHLRGVHRKPGGLRNAVQPRDGAASARAGRAAPDRRVRTARTADGAGALMAQRLPRRRHLPNRRRPADGIPTTCPGNAAGRRRRCTAATDYDVLAEADAWDEPTRKVVLARVDECRRAASSRSPRPPHWRRSAMTCWRRTPSPLPVVCSWTPSMRREDRGLPLHRDAARRRHVAARRRGLYAAVAATGRTHAPAAAQEMRSSTRSPPARSPAARGITSTSAAPGRRHTRRAGRVLRAPMGLERDRLRRPGLPSRLRPDGGWPERGLGGRRGDRSGSRRGREAEGLE